MIKFEDLIWPRTHRIEALAEVLSKDTLISLIFHFADRPEKERIIKLPKRQTILKVLAYYYGDKVANGEMTWDEVMEELKGEEFNLLKEIGVDRMYIRKLYFQRQKEIKAEKRRAEKRMKEKAREVIKNES